MQLSISQQAVDASCIKTFWHGIDLGWAYGDLLPNIYRKTSCRQFALDVLHDSLVRFALTKNPNRDEQPQAYLQVIVRNLLIDDHHERKRFVPLITEDTGDRPDSANPTFLHQAFTPSAEHLADIQQRIHAMQQLIDSLPPRCREAFWLYRIDGMNQTDIAAQLGISLNMVQRHVMRAMLELLDATDLIR
ncbi:MAG: sigma-70 family RNA polymerase sigma factor [Candidatus Methylopumilus sp.]|jgi:RNA polymerase sigma-70 factor (ECF subfamily)